MGLFYTSFGDMAVHSMVVGLKKGHKVVKNNLKPKPSSRKGLNSKHNKFIRDVVREVTGYAAYEKRVIELLKVSRDKRALKFLKNRLGGHNRSKRKRNEMQRVMAQQRKAAAAA